MVGAEKCCQKTYRVLIRQTAIECLRAEAQAITDLIPRLDESFDKAVQLMLDCKGKVIITGVGKSGHIATKIAATLASMGTPSFFLNPLDAYHGDLGMLTPNDTLIAISYSGNTEELLRFIPLLKERGISVIALTGKTDSLLARYADVVLDVAVSREADPLNLAPTSSTTAALALGDALACAIAKARDFQPADFARLHPGGDLGRRLLTRVEDMMVRDNLPLLRPDCPMSEAIEVVTNGKLGVGIVVENGRLRGIITDGDVRRAMQAYKAEFFTTPVSEIMTPTPKTIRAKDRIVDAGEQMNHYSIHSLVVLNEQEEVVGVIDSFSCLPGTRFYH